MGALQHRALWVALLLCGEIVALAGLYQFLNLIDCSQTGSYNTCRFLRSLVARGLVVFAAGLLYATARPLARAAFAAGAACNPSARIWASVHFLGVALLVLPALVSGGATLSASFALVAPVLALGAVLAAIGGVFWLAPPALWADLIRRDPVVLPLAFAIAVVLPDIADLAQPLWGIQGLTRMTFVAVERLLAVFSPATLVDEAAYVIGLDHFVVRIAQACSGVEGFALVGGFVTIYAALFAREVRVGRILAVLLPLGILLSWVLNVVRIAVLILIGARISPDLAVNGFHSYAGWLFFLLLALGVLYAGHAVPWFQRERRAAPAMAGSLREDRLAALIVPFIVFMFASVAAGAFFPHPELGYPLKALAMVAVVVYFLPAYRGFVWRPNPLALVAGAAVGVFWLLLAEAGAEGEGSLGEALAPLGPGLLAGWLVARVLGTVLLVPLIEEAFFRGYVLTRIAGLRGGGKLAAVAAIALSSALFAALHGRWLAAGAAGVVFALVMLRRGRLGEAVQAHVAANLVVAIGAAAAGDWTLI